jgi:DNA polymerase-3 subunit epsilon
VAARPDGSGGWHLAVIRHGQLAAAGNAPKGVPPMPVVDAIAAGAQVVLPTEAPLGGALVEETALVARWLATPGVRIVRTDSGYATPAAAAGRFAAWAASARSARIAAEHAGRDGTDWDVLRSPYDWMRPSRPAADVGAQVS